jgi:hypothetical protein
VITPTRHSAAEQREPFNAKGTGENLRRLEA